MALSTAARRRHAPTDRRREARRLRVTRVAARAAAARAAGALVGASRGERMADRADRDARGPRALLLSVRGPARASRPRDAVLVPAVAGGAADVQPHRQRLRLRPAVADAHRAHAGRPREVAGGARHRSRHPRGAQRRRAGSPAVPRDRARRGPHLPGLSGRAQSGAAAAGVLGAAVRSLRRIRSRTTCCCGRRCAKCSNGASRRRGSPRR